MAGFHRWQPSARQGASRQASPPIGEGTTIRYIVVTGNMGPKTRTTWLYTKGHDTIRLTVDGHRHGFELVIAGPGRRRKALEFSDAMSLVQHQSTLEASLLIQGYSFEGLTTVRCGSVDRRAFRRRTDRPVLDQP
jgi:hypothetical protein